MKTLFAVLAASASLAAWAQSQTPMPEVGGTWQASLPAQRIRMVIHIARTGAGGWQATMYLDDTNPIPVDSVTVGSGTLEFAANLGRYVGAISADGNSIHGFWLHGNPRLLGSPLVLDLQRATRQTLWSLPQDSSPHTTRYLTVDKGTSLEVLDWGGSGRPLILLAGLGSTAHDFDQFAPKLTPRYHVYGITRRGFGNSSAPLTGYSADRLGDDVLAVLDALHLVKPILVGHSLAGEELSSIGSRYPQRVAGLVYLDAGYEYAYTPPQRPTPTIVQADELERKFNELRFGSPPADPVPVIQDLLNTDLPLLRQSLLAELRTLQETPAALRTAQPSTPVRRVSPLVQDILAGEERYTKIPVPILAIFVTRHEVSPSEVNNPAFSRAAVDAADAGARETADAFEHGLPSARVVRLAHASHEVFRSNEADVLREMNAFISGLP